MDKLGGGKKESFIERLSRELARGGKTRLDLESGVWHDLNEIVRHNRNIFVHSGVESAEKCFPPFSIADDAIKWTRSGIQEIYARTGKICPRWVATDHIGGWPESRGGFRMSGVLTVSEAGAKPNSPGVIKLAFVREDGKEDDYRYFPPETPDAILDSWVENILGGELMNFPYAKLRVYHGSKFVEQEFDTR